MMLLAADTEVQHKSKAIRQVGGLDLLKVGVSASK